MLSVVVAATWHRYGVRILLATVAVLGASLAVLQGGYRDLLLDPYVEMRYFILPGVLAISAVIISVARQRGRAQVTAKFLGALAVAAVVGDFRIPPHPYQDWETGSRCIGSATPCDIAVDPADRWTIHWPGSSGRYDQPLR
jgi:hypothetical protein